MEHNTGTIFLDIYANGISVDSNYDIKNKKNIISCRLTGQPEECVEMFLKAYSAMNNCFKYAIFIGHKQDPLIPWSDKLCSFLKVLQKIEMEFTGPVIIKTASSLITLALPILKSFDNRINVFCVSTNAGRHLTERRLVVETLRNHKIKANLIDSGSKKYYLA